jgi:hypothetical protein
MLPHGGVKPVNSNVELMRRMRSRGGSKSDTLEENTYRKLFREKHFAALTGQVESAAAGWG